MEWIRWVEVAVAVTVLIGAVAGGARWLLKKIKEEHGEDLLAYSTQELVRASAEQLTRIEQDQRKLAAQYAQGLDEMARALREHMEEEVEIAKESVKMVARMAGAVEGRTSALFRQSVFAADVAYYELARDSAEDPWRLEWVNPAYMELAGLTLDKAAAGGFWEVVAHEDRDRVNPISEAHLEDGTRPLDISFTLVNQVHGERIPVRVMSTPISPVGTGPVKSFVGAVLRVPAKASS